MTENKTLFIIFIAGLTFNIDYFFLSFFFFLKNNLNNHLDFEGYKGKFSGCFYYLF